MQISISNTLTYTVLIMVMLVCL